MRFIDSLRHRLHSLFHRDAANAELNDELRFHLDTLIERNIARGMSPRQARTAAQKEFGSFAEATQSTYESRGTALLEDLAQDVRYGVRSLRRQPGFTAVTVLTLAIGIGACTAIFSLVNAVLLRSLPYGDASRLVYLYTPNPHLKEIPQEATGPSNADFFEIRAQVRSFASMTMFDQKSMNLNTGDQPERVGVARVDSSFFHTLEAAPLIGREFRDADQEPGNSRSVVLSYSLWQSLFAGSDDVLSRNITLDGETYHVVGVMPSGFGYPHKTDLAFGNGNIADTQLWVPIALTAQERASRDPSSINALARLAPGVSVKDAQAEMSPLVARLQPLHHDLIFSGGMIALVKPLTQTVLGGARPLMLLLLGAVGSVLLIACANAANLLLARAAGRRHELGVRTTLGASRGRLVRQMLTESLLLASAAGIIGVGLALFFIRALIKLNPGNIPHMETTSLDLRTMVFLILISFVTSILFGTLPALSGTRINVADFLSSAGTRLIVDRRRLRRGLVVAQVALVVVLLTGAGLFLRSYRKVLSVQAGFSPSTLTAGLPVSTSADTEDKRRAFYASVLEGVSSQPGLSAAGLVNYLPLSDSESITTLWVDGYPNQKNQWVESRDVSSGYFTAMQIPLLRGRYFTAEEDTSAPRFVVIINQTFANTYLAGKDPIGHRLRTNSDDPWATIVGVVQDIRNESIETAAVPQIYTPFFSSFAPPIGVTVAVRSSLPQSATIAALRSAVRSIDPNLPLSHIRLMSELTAHATAPRRFQTTLLSVFSGIALFLAIVGVYGLLAYTVRQRTGEIGLRMALGSSRAHIARLILNEGLSLLLAGLGIGIVGGIAFAHLLRSFLYQVPALDPLTFVLVPVLLLIATLVACLVPSIRAAAIDPMVALRHE
ncbi:ABC transporter permease [Terriglobus albidus]|uniref:ABC transporter permease n=1 Tax=Terriglobus albidus TaxID=1592106 RepID=A0A5B9EGL8_9BACT|nr:ABC transporter permease [Terriglobus albidus]QEE30734.1 ABC transporter permease [Terriglobus albidus]